MKFELEIENTRFNDNFKYAVTFFTGYSIVFQILSTDKFKDNSAAEIARLGFLLYLLYLYNLVRWKLDFHKNTKGKNSTKIKFYPKLPYLLYMFQIKYQIKCSIKFTNSCLLVPLCYNFVNTKHIHSIIKYLTILNLVT